VPAFLYPVANVQVLLCLRKMSPQVGPLFAAWIVVPVLVGVQFECTVRRISSSAQASDMGLAHIGFW